MPTFPLFRARSHRNFCLNACVCLAGLLVFAIALPGLRIAARLGCGKEVESRALRPGLELTVKTGREN